MEEVRIIVALCELRQGFRHFRTDRITSVDVTSKRIAERRQELVKQWQASQHRSRSEVQSFE